MADTFALDHHIRIDDHGTAWVAGTNFKVIDVVLAKIAWGFSPEEIHFQFDRRLSLSQIHAALTWYYDHQAAIDAIIKRDFDAANSARDTAGPSPFAQRLRAEGRLP